MFQILRRHLFKYDYVDCPSGSQKRVYRNATSAFPLFVRGFQAKMSAGVDTGGLQNASINAQYKRNVDTLLFILDDGSGDLPLLFHAAYVVYQTDPCKYDEYLRLEIQAITERHQWLKSKRIAISAYINLIRNGADPSVLEDTFNSLVKDLRPSAHQATIDSITQSRAAAKKIMEKL